MFATNGFSGSDKSTFPAVQTSSIGTSAVERNLKDNRSSIPPKFQMNSVTEPPSSYPHESYENRAHRVDRDASSMENQRGVRTRSLVANWEKKDRSPGHEGYASSNPSVAVSSVNTLPLNVWQWQQ